ncbi:hypothetical protein [Roseibacillus ishigakijimensis]|uniref:Uncharacterized protein n=1 Tax=Roseibacillus ishigakijimensis TaxID=454146 RepID=A0A934VIE6_9BACT|nr:hypothetical protein [Roseibacillus ishigakijimensis]MBK1834993.1 hypothetical protein [Roseibacillus ishigakijimensis]
MSRLYQNEHSWPQLRLEGRHGLVDLGLSQHAITEVSGVVVEDNLIKLTDGSFRVRELFRVAPPVPHSAGQTVHDWAIVLRLKELTEFTISAENPLKGMFWRQTETHATIKMAGLESEGEIPFPWARTMVLQMHGAQAAYSVLHTGKEELRFPSRNCVAFGGMTFSGTAVISSLKIVKARVGIPVGGVIRYLDE